MAETFGGGGPSGPVEPPVPVPARTPAGAMSGALATAGRSSNRFLQVIDLTHPLGPDFPTWDGRSQLTIKSLSTLERHGWNARCWRLDEHTGTHLDAPFHKSNGRTADQIPAAELVGPLAVIDLRSKAERDADAELTLDDVTRWEATHGPLPRGAIVAMCSGWDAHVRTRKFRNADASGALHFPGFHVEAVEFLLAERDVKGIVVDTLSLDRGLSKEFPVHVRWLGSDRWGVESAANLGELPALGATAVVGGPTVVGATGGPSRVLALL